MKRDKIVLIIELAILAAIITLFIATCKNGDIFNSMEINGYKASGNEVLYGLNSSGKTVTIIFDENSVKIKNSYEFSSKEEVYEISKFIRKYLEKQGIVILRKNIEIAGEIMLHNNLFRIGFMRQSTANADIDYVADQRWYVNVFSVVLGVLQ